MSIRFIMGGSGSGKSRCLYNSIIEQSIRLGTSILKYRTHALSASTLLSRLNNSSVKNGNHYYKETVDGIRYFLTSAVDGHFDNVMISIE